MFYLKFENLEMRSHVMSALKENQIMAVFHYIPLHSSPAGLALGRFCGEDRYTTSESERLLRMPLWFGIEERIIEKIVRVVASTVS